MYMWVRGLLPWVGHHCAEVVQMQLNEPCLPVRSGEREVKPENNSNTGLRANFSASTVILHVHIVVGRYILQSVCTMYYVLCTYVRPCASTLSMPAEDSFNSTLLNLWHACYGCCYVVDDAIWV